MNIVNILLLKLLLLIKIYNKNYHLRTIYKICIQISFNWKSKKLKINKRTINNSQIQKV